MTNCIFYALFFVLFLNVSLGSLKFSQVNRTFMSMYKGIFEASSISIDEKGEPIFPYYEKNVLENYVNDFLDANLDRYVKDYTVNINYVYENKEICDEYCSFVNINLKADINYFIKYDKTQTFLIMEKNSL